MREQSFKKWGLGLLIGMIALAFFFLARAPVNDDDEWSVPSVQTESTLLETAPMTTIISSQTPVTGPFYIVGSIRNPGIYTIKEHTYLYEVIEMAGGFTEDADSERVNLATTVVVGGMLRVPQKGESASAEVIHPMQSSTVQDGPTKVALNQATQADLERLPGVGPATATAILRLRDSKEGFNSLEELMEVPGIKERKFAQLAPYLILNEGEE